MLFRPFREASSLTLVWLIGALALPSQSAAQGLPPYMPVNPVLTSRSPLYFQPYLDPGSKWRFRTLMDYGSAIEFNDYPSEDRRFVLDAELLRLEMTVDHDLGARGFAGISTSFNGAYNGFLDGFLNWYHRFTGLRVAAREIRPNNAFDYELKIPGQPLIVRSASSGFLGDTRLFAGYRFSRHWQASAAVILPTNTGPDGYGRGTVGLAASTTVRAPLDHRWTFEGAAGIGYTPTHGDLADYQKTVFESLNAGIRYRFSGKQAAFINLWYQSSNYHDTQSTSLDGHEWTLDYGFLLRARKGPEWFLGMTEDIQPNGPSIDLSFRIGARW
jgi:hypothetical protein